MARLIIGAKAHKKDCYARLYELYAARLFRYIRAVVQDSMAAEDLTADVFVRLFERIGSFTPKPDYVAGSFTMWILRIAHNLAIDHLRAAPGYSEAEPQEQAGGGAEALPVRVDGPPIETLDLGRALERLTPDQRAVIVLRFQEDLPFAEIGAALGKTEGAVKALQLRALSTLAVLLREPEKEKGEIRPTQAMAVPQRG